MVNIIKDESFVGPHMIAMQRPTYRKMQILIRARKATTIKTKTHAQMKRLGMANV